jgi:hypothetical protein
MKLGERTRSKDSYVGSGGGRTESRHSRSSQGRRRRSTGRAKRANPPNQVVTLNKFLLTEQNKLLMKTSGEFTAVISAIRVIIKKQASIISNVGIVEKYV